jgi:Probable zinc-ribbon domain
MSTYQDKELTCADCGGKFLFSAKDQEFFAEKGFQEPKRCRDCRQAKKEQRGDRGEWKGGDR